MKDWLKVSLLLCIFGIFRDNRPSEPFITEYLLHEYPGNLTHQQISQEVFPLGTYFYAAQLIIVFLITDFLRYKPLIIVIGISGIIVWSLLIWTKSLIAIQIVEFLYGTYMAAEVAYYTYIYAKVDKKYYTKVTSHTRAAMLAGKLFASISSQILIHFRVLTYGGLNYITLASQTVATFWAMFLPPVKTSIYFHRKDETGTPYNGSLEEITVSDNKHKISPLKLLWSHFWNAYSNVKVVQWSIWYSLGLCGHLQVINYIQLLWADITIGQQQMVWNGAVEAVLTFLGACFALLAGYVHTSRLNSQVSLLIFAGLSCLEGSALLLAALTHNIYCAYGGYIVFGALFAFSITISSAEVARHLQEESFGLVFGINTLAATALQSLLTVIVVSETGLALNVMQQYVVYGFYFIAIGVLYVFFAVFEYLYREFYS